MILYDNQRVSFIWRCNGSKIPKAAMYAIPSIVIAVVFHLFINAYQESFRFLDEVNPSVVWSAMVIIHGLLLGLRTTKAYDRFWEGITLVQQMRAEWFEATSNLLAFTVITQKSGDKDIVDKVHEFQGVLVRLMSLMHGAALRQIGGALEEFEVLDLQGLDVGSLQYLAECEKHGTNQVETILHWIQVLVTESVSNGVIDVQAPIVSRAYQTLSRGMVNMHNARKLADVPFPFPLSQVIVVLLLVTAILAPCFVASIVSQPVYAAVVTFVPIFGMWSITFISGELEQPFGSDPNDLPLSVLQYDFNMTLMMLLDEEAARAPRLKHKRTSVAQLRHTIIAGIENPLSMTNSFRKQRGKSVSMSNISFSDASANWSQLPSKRTSLSHQELLAFRRKRTHSFGSFGNASETSKTRVSEVKLRELEEKDIVRLPERQTSTNSSTDRNSAGLVQHDSDHLISIPEDQDEPYGLSASYKSSLAGINSTGTNLVSSMGTSLYFASNPSMDPTARASASHSSMQFNDRSETCETRQKLPQLSEEHLNALIQVTKVLSMSMQGQRASPTPQIPLTTPQIPLTPIFSQRVCAPKKVRTPQTASPMPSPRDLDDEASNGTSMRVSSNLKNRTEEQCLRVSGNPF